MKLEIGDKVDTLNFYRKQQLVMDAAGRLRPYRWYRRFWDRLWAFRRPVTFGVVTKVDVVLGAITTRSVPARWSWLRWKWVPRA